MADSLLPVVENSVTGFEEVMRAMKEFGKTESKKLFRKVARAVTKEVLVEAKRLAPVEYGTLEDSLTVKAAKLSRRSGDVGSQVTTKEGLFAGETFYGGFQEFGWVSGGKHHEGNPFLRPAIYDHRTRWNNLAHETARRMLPAAVEAARKRAGAKK